MNRRLTTDVFPASVDWVPVPDEHGRFPAGGHARHYAHPDPGVRARTQFMAFDEETRDRAAQYLRDRMLDDDPAPFCLTVSFHHPHDPFHVRQEYWDRFEGVDIPLGRVGDDAPRSVMDEWANEAHETSAHPLTEPGSLTRLRRAYYAALSYVDDMIAELIAALRESGDDDDTLVLFTSDHGDMLAERGMVQKRCFYEWSARVPLLLRLPGGKHAGESVVTPVSLTDVLPTVLDVIGVPEDARAPMQGESLLPLLDAERPDRPVFSEYHLEKVHAPCFMVRRGPYKYVLVHGHDEQLFDLERDPDELDDLSDSASHAEVRDELRSLLLDRFDPDALAAAGERSIRNRLVVRDANAANGTRWDYAPPSRADRFVR